jgi:4-amino-4-deoxy-L-arabinose transferase-like glycosyltransferase
VAGAGGRRAVGERLAGSRALPVLIVGVLTVIGVALRLVVIGQSLFADELSSYWIVSAHSFSGVVSTVHTDAEITPPLYFLLAWLTTQIDLTPELLRAPSLLAGTAAIPLTYLLGLRTVGRPAALLASALTALSPFMIFYSTEARGYELAIVLVMLSTLAMLAAVDSGRARWWIAYGACSCAAVYTHYTVVFALAAQLLWLLWTHPQARKPALLANTAAIIGFLPWTSGLIADFNSPTTDIVDAFSSVTLYSARINLGHWVLGHPMNIHSTRLDAVPGAAAFVLLTLGVVVAIAGLVLARFRRRGSALGVLPGHRLVLILALALSVPVGEALFSTVATDTFSARYFAVSWPGFALVLATLLVAAGPRLRFAAAALALASFAIGAAKMLETRLQRPDYDAAASFIERTASRGDVVIDGANFSPAPPTGLDAALDGPYRVFHVSKNHVQYDPFKVLARAPPPTDVTGRAVAAAGGRRVFVVAGETVYARQPPTEVPPIKAVTDAMPPSYRLVDTRAYPGILRIAVLVYADRASARG